MLVSPNVSDLQARSLAATAEGPVHDHTTRDHLGHDHSDGGRDGPVGGGGRAFGPVVLIVPFLVAFAARSRIGWLAEDNVRLWSTLFVSVCVQALPFLVLGVVLSGMIAAFVSPQLVERVVPKRSIFAVPAAGVAGIALPGCECGSVPIAGSLISAGTPPAGGVASVFVDLPPGVPGGGARHRPQADRHAVGGVRPGLHRPLRPPHVHRGRGLGRTRRAVGVVSGNVVGTRTPERRS